MAALVACAGRTQGGGLMVIVATNMRVPADFDVLHIDVRQEAEPGIWGGVLFAKDFRLPDQATLPTTLLIAAGKHPDQKARIRVTARKGAATIVLREAELQIPTTRVAELRLVISYLCRGQVTVTNGDPQSTCADPHQSCQPDTGACGPNEIDPATLPDYRPEDVAVDAGSSPADAGIDAIPDAGGDATLDGPADLTALTTSAGTLSPAFSPSLHTYSVNAGALALVPFTVTPTAARDDAQITVDGQVAQSGAPSRAITLSPGGTTPIVVSVAAPGADTEQTSILVRQDVEYTYIKASTPRFDARFGDAIVLDGDTLAVGARKDPSAATGVDAANEADQSMPGAGAVYVFTRTAGAWAQTAYIKASDTAAGAAFGASLGLSGDTLAVGSYNDGVYIFTRTAGRWTQSKKLTQGSLSFGTAVALAGDTLAVGDPDNSRAFVFRRGAGDWPLDQAVAGTPASSFGASIAIDKDTLAVGAHVDASGATGVSAAPAVDNTAKNSGAVYVFTRGDGTWPLQAYVKPSNTRADADFGKSVSVRGDTLAVGSPGESSGVVGDPASTSAPGAGAAYVFQRSGAAWSPEGYVKASNTLAGAGFGVSVALGASNTLAVGADSESSAATGINGNQSDASAAYAGAAYVFGLDAGAWSQHAYVKASNTRKGPTGYAYFGSWVASDGDSLVVGATGEYSASPGVGANPSDTSAQSAGAVYVIR